MRLELPRSCEFGAGVWYSTHASTWYPAHYHDELELKLVLSGETSYRVGAEEVTLRAGSLLWLWPGQEHAVVDASIELAMWVASFRVDTIRAVEVAAGHLDLSRSRGWQLYALSLSNARELSVTFAAMASGIPEIVNFRSVRLLNHALALSCSRADVQRAGEPAGYTWHPAVVRARALLGDCASGLSIADVARQCGTGPARLSRLFRKQMGLAPVQFRNHARVQSFIALFGHTSRNMLQAALDSGFGSYPQFHRVFYQVTGYAPSEHLRRVRAGLVFPVSQSANAQFAREQQGYRGQ